jgi:hypothetical protein
MKNFRARHILGDSPTMTMFFWLFAALLICKLTGVLTISWWLVTAPLWAPVILTAILMFGFLGHVMLGGFLGPNPSKENDNDG